VAALDRLVMIAGTVTNAGAVAALEVERNCPSRRHSRSLNSGNDSNMLEQEPLERLDLGTGTGKLEFITSTEC
jgi:hypothetical protein